MCTNTGGGSGNDDGGNDDGDGGSGFSEGSIAGILIGTIAGFFFML